MKKLVLISGLSFSSIALSTVSVPYTFNADTAISASEMNANFTALAAGINGIFPDGTTANQFLQTDGAGNYTWATAAAASSGVTSIGGQTGAAQSLAVDTTGAGTAPAWASAADIHTLNIPLASNTGVTAGLISNNDYTTLNTVSLKLNATGGTMTGTLNMNANMVFASTPVINFSAGTDAVIGTTDAYSFGIKTNNTTQMTVDSDGDVGIGTTTPTNRLHLHSTTTDSHVQFTIADASSPTASDGFKVGYNTNGAVIWNQESTDMTFGTNNTERMRIDSSGYVGIGTITPGALLQVGELSDGSVALANAWNSLSDVRLKKNLKPIDSALEKILSLNGYYFHWKNGKHKGRQMGIKAQEVQQTFPEIVHKGGNGFLSVSYDKLVAPLIEATKKLYALITDHQQELARLKAENDALKSYLCAKDSAAPFCHKP